jgi:hemerythrin-like domain-containing protein
MRPTEILQNEHRVIERVLDCLELIIKRTLAGHPFPAKDATDIVDFLGNFADRYHHGKEEHHLFRVMETRGFSADEGPTAAMRHEHTIGRQCVGIMRESIPAAERADPAASKAFAEAGAAFIELLRQHIAKEDGVLYVMADRMLSETDQRSLGEDFAQVEANEGETGALFRAVADRLCATYAVTTGTRQTFSCGHM